MSSSGRSRVTRRAWGIGRGDVIDESTSRLVDSRPVDSWPRSASSCSRSCRRRPARSSPASRLEHRRRAAAIGLLGLAATLGVLVYELRNAQIRRAVARRVQRARAAARRRAARRRAAAVLGGLRLGHSLGVALVYGAALAGWSYLVAWGVLRAAGLDHARAIGLALGAVAGGSGAGADRQLERVATADAPQPGYAARLTASLALVEFEHVLVVGAGPDGRRDRPGRRRLGPPRLAARPVPGRGRARARDDAEEPRRSWRRRAAPTRTRCSRASTPVDELVAGRPDDRGGRRGRGRQGGRLPPRRRVLPAGGRPRLEHVVDPDHVARRRDRAARPRDRHALLQPGARAGARRGDPRPARPPTRRRRRSSRSPRSSARRRPRRATSPASSRTGS